MLNIQIPMWRTFRNFVNHLQTYPLLSPDLAARKQVNQWLRARPCLTVEGWLQRYWVPPTIPKALPSPLIEFVYQHLTEYSGLAIGRVYPSDRLVEDLKFPLVCWFDWGLTLCDDFQTCFGIDITDTFDETAFITIADLVYYLNDQM